MYYFRYYFIFLMASFDEQRFLILMKYITNHLFSYLLLVSENLPASCKDILLYFSLIVDYAFMLRSIIHFEIIFYLVWDTQNKMGELHNFGVKKARCKECIPYKSVYMKFHSRSNSAVVITEIKHRCFGRERGVTQNGTRKVTGVVEMFHILIKVVFTYICNIYAHTYTYKYISIYAWVTNPIKCTIKVYFTLCNLYFI